MVESVDPAVRRKSIRFLKEVLVGKRVHVAGDVALVEEHRAKALVEAGAAVYQPPRSEVPDRREAVREPRTRKAVRNP
jgi:hypothetical protein